jgi:RNA polymerase sigma-70 factor (ECF subfamily)
MLVRVGSQQEAEDLAQEVFIKALKALPGYEFRGSPFAAWLFRIAHNVVVDRHRQRGGSAQVPLDTAEPISSAEDVAADALRAVDMEQVHKALQRLTELQRQVILCRFVAELSLAETAQSMGRDVNAIKTLQHAALRSLRRELEREGSVTRKVDA